MQMFTDRQWRLVKPADLGTIEAAAAALDAVACAGLELQAAQAALDDAERELATHCASQAEAVADASARLRAEVAKRGEAEQRHNAEVLAKCGEVMAIFPELAVKFTGQLVARQYADGSTPIGEAVVVNIATGETYAPAVASANREAVAAFKPALHDAPDTDALRVKTCEAVALFRRVADAHARHKAALQALHDALAVLDDMQAAFDAELDREAESVAAASAI